MFQIILEEIFFFMWDTVLKILKLDSVFLCNCLVLDSRRCQNLVKTLVTSVRLVCADACAET